MSTKAEHFRQSKSSNEQYFEALNQMHDRNDQLKSRPSGSSDFENINDRKMQQVQIHEHENKRSSNVEQQLHTLQRLIVNNEKSIEEQLNILKSEYKQREKEIMSLQLQNCQLKKKNYQLQENTILYKEQIENFKRKIEQQSNVSSSIPKVSQIIQVSQNSDQKDFTKKKTLRLTQSIEQDLRQRLKEYEYKMNSLKTKLQFFTQEDRKIREFLLKFLKFNPSFTMQLSTLVESAVISLDSNLKEVNREIQNIILSSHLGNSSKIIARRQKMQEEKYNHWQVLSNLDVIKEYIGQLYRCK